jgi:hypothetical protein
MFIFHPLTWGEVYRVLERMAGRGGRHTVAEAVMVLPLSIVFLSLPLVLLAHRLVLLVIFSFLHIVLVKLNSSN